MTNVTSLVVVTRISLLIGFKLQREFADKLQVIAAVIPPPLENEIQSEMVLQTQHRHSNEAFKQLPVWCIASTSR